MRAPKPVARGTVGVFAPSSPYPPERFRAGVEMIESLGFTVRSPEPIAHGGYLAGDDASRAEQLHALLEDDGVDVLWAARGGYGLHRIVDRLDPALLARAGKPIIGFSDVCALHALAQSQAELITFHGPVVTQVGDLGLESAQHTARLLAGQWAGVEYLANREALSGGRVEGRLVGGCLSVITPLVGTPFLPDFEGAILLLEDVGEATYRVDRMLTHLHLAGLLDRVAGVALGEFVGCLPRKDREGDWTIDEVLQDRLGDLGVPVLAGLPFGHGHSNLTIPLGARVELDAGQRRLTLLGP